MRKKSRRTLVPLEKAIIPDDDDPVADTEHRATIEELAIATQKLTKAQQEVISLRFAGELSVAEVAKAMGKTEGAVKALQHSAIMALRRVMSAGTA